MRLTFFIGFGSELFPSVRSGGSLRADIVTMSARSFFFYGWPVDTDSFPL